MKRLFTFFVLLGLSISTLFSQIPELLYYKFDSPGISVQNHASSPVGSNPATITGTGLSIGSTGLSGSALVGTGVTATSGVINTGWFTNLSGSFTLAFWTSGIVPSSTLWYIWGDAGASSLRCFTNGAAGANNWMLRGGGLPDLTITGGATSGSNMMHAVYDATTAQYRGYLNGVLVSTVNVTSVISMSGSGFQIGGYSSNSNLNGKMDEFRIYNRALTQAEITATWNQSIGSITDLALTGFANLSDSTCSGNNPIAVWMKNNGPQPLSSAKIGWQINSQIQPDYQWSGTLPVNDSVAVTIGYYPFVAATSNTVGVYISEVNNGADTLNNTNDSLLKPNIYTKPSPTLSLIDTTILICNGDTALVQGLFTGTPPWSLLLVDGTITMPVNNIQSSGFVLPLYTTLSKTYHIMNITDGSGCTNHDTIALHIGVVPAPPANITPPGPHTACQGDSISLMASVGLNFSYQWKKDGIDLPGAVNYLYHAKAGGSYTVEVFSPAGCSALSSPVIITIHPAPTVTLGNDTAILPGQTVILNAGSGFTSYLWSTGATTQTINASSAIVGVIPYWVQVTDNNGCKGGDTIKINFTNHPGIDGNDNSLTLRPVPNPTSGKLDIIGMVAQTEITHLDVYLSTGHKVYSLDITPDQWVSNACKLDLTHLSEGMYLVSVKSQSKSQTFKLMIIK